MLGRSAGGLREHGRLEHLTISAWNQASSGNTRPLPSIPLHLEVHMVIRSCGITAVLALSLPCGAPVLAKHRIHPSHQAASRCPSEGRRTPRRERIRARKIWAPPAGPAARPTRRRPTRTNPQPLRASIPLSANNKTARNADLRQSRFAPDRIGFSRSTSGSSRRSLPLRSRRS
jgi:hypothetical protein